MGTLGSKAAAAVAPSDMRTNAGAWPFFGGAMRTGDTVCFAAGHSSSLAVGLAGSATGDAGMGLSASASRVRATCTLNPLGGGILCAGTF